MLLLFDYDFWLQQNTPVVLPTNQTTLAQRLTSLLPQSWFSSAALTTNAGVNNNGIVGSIMQGVGAVLALIYNQLQYAKLQSRLATASDVQVDLASIDFFAYGWPRYYGETDRAFATRIIQRLLWPQPTLIGIADAVNSWLYGLQFLPKMPPLGADTYGATDTSGSLDAPYANRVQPPGIGLDTYDYLDLTGGLDVSTVQTNPPSVYVFDYASDPVTSALVGITATNGEFGIFFNYPGYPISAIHAISSYSPTLTYIVNYVKAEGMTPVYCSNYL